MFVRRKGNGSRFHAAKSIGYRYGVVPVVGGVGLANDQCGIGLPGQSGAVLFPLISEVFSGRSGFQVILRKSTSERTAGAGPILGLR